MITALITSAAYVSPEIAAEVGLLPPAFLPVANSRLFLHQIQELRHWAERVVISIPESYKVPEHDAAILGKADVELLHVPDGLSLAESISYAILSCMQADDHLVILHGDTLIRGIGSLLSEGFSVHDVSHPYPWAIFNRTTRRLTAVDLAKHTYDSGPILSGLFHFESSLKLLRCLNKSRGKFVDAINLYAGEAPGFVPWDNVGEWLDFGHLNLFFQSRKRMTTERAFNRLMVEDLVVTKTSDDAHKMNAEAYWFENIPAMLRINSPAYLGRVSGMPAGYRLSYEALCPLSDLYVFGTLPATTWQRIFLACATFIKNCSSIKSLHDELKWSAEDVIEKLLVEKTRGRVTQYPEHLKALASKEVRLNGQLVPSALTIIDEATSRLKRANLGLPSLMHGDFCFSNILYDARRDTIKVIDPRGYVGDDIGLCGIALYDIAKLHHSVRGLYDFMIAGYFDLEFNADNDLTFKVAAPPSHSSIVDVYRSCFETFHGFEYADWIAILLFFSMVPLHYDNPRRQIAFFANALRIYQEIVE